MRDADASRNTDAKPADGVPAAIGEWLNNRAARLVDFWFTELGGRSWRLTINAECLGPEIFSNGVVVDGRQVGGSWEGLISLVPDPSALFIDPFASVPTLSILCGIRKASGEPYVEDCRSVLQRAEAHLSRHPVAASWAVGAEVEFFVFEPSGRPLADDPLRELLRGLWRALTAAGIPVDWFRVGPARGQGRVQMRAASALKTADQVITYKRLARAVARNNGKTIRFMAKPFAGDGSAAMLVHHALWRDGANLFHDADGWARTSELCRWFAGGLLRHASALLAFSAPTMNSYRRLLPGDGPTDLVLSKTRNAALCRVPAGTTGPSPAARRVKFCGADPGANPYLAFAAMLMAGLDGIEKQIDPSIDDASGRERVPQGLESALAALAADADFLKCGAVFSDALIDGWIADRWKRQIMPVRSVPHPVEFNLDEED